MSHNFRTFIRQNVSPYSSEEDEGEIVENGQAEPVEDNNVNGPQNQSSSQSNNKFSIWSNMLLEEELTEGINANLSVKNAKNIPNDRDVESYDFMLAFKGKKKKKKAKTKKNQANNDKEKTENFKFKSKKNINNFKARKQCEMIASKLKEKRKDLIIKAIKFLGFDQVVNILNQVLFIEGAGGMMTNDNKRRRTPGGIFFHLLKNCGKLTEAQMEQLFKEKQFIKEKKNIS